MSLCEWVTPEHSPNPSPLPNQHFNNQQRKKEDSRSVRHLYIYLFWMYSAKVPTTGEWNVHFVRCELWKEQGSRADTVRFLIGSPSFLSLSFFRLSLLFFLSRSWYFYFFLLIRLPWRCITWEWRKVVRHGLSFGDIHSSMSCIKRFDQKKKRLNRSTLKLNSRWFSLQ